MSSSWKSNNYNNTKNNIGTEHRLATHCDWNITKWPPPPPNATRRLSVRPCVRHSFMTHTDDACSLFSYCTVIYAPPKLKNCMLSVSSCPCVHVRVCLLANQTSAMAQQCSQSLFDIYHIRCLFLEETVHSFRSIFSIIIARYIINGRGHVAQLKLATKMKNLPITGRKVLHSHAQFA